MTQPADVAAADDEEENDFDDSFGVMGIPRTFAISESDLKNSYRRLMIEFHPDKHAYKSLPEQQEIVQKASQVTRAYQLLKEPHTRATHLLELMGSPMDETSQADLVGTEFLMEVMELRESVDSTGPAYLKPLWDETQQHLAENQQDLHDAFEAADLKTAMGLSARLQFWNRIQTAIHEKMELE